MIYKIVLVCAQGETNFKYDTKCIAQKDQLRNKISIQICKL